MVNDTTVNIISDALIFRFALGILLGSCEDILHILPIGSNAADGQRTADG